MPWGRAPAPPTLRRVGEITGKRHRMLTPAMSHAWNVSSPVRSLADLGCFASKETLVCCERLQRIAAVASFRGKQALGLTWCNYEESASESVKTRERTLCRFRAEESQSNGQT